MIAPEQSAGVLRYDDVEHRYWIGERELVPVTRVLEIENFVDPRWFTEESRIRGTYVHQACDLDDQGALDEDELHAELVPYVDAYRLFKHEMGIPSFDHVELPLGDLCLGVAGRLDRLQGGHLWDLKSGGDEPSHAFQTALYALLAEHNEIVPSARRLTRACVYLGSDGRYSIEWHPEPSDLRLAKCAAEVAVYKVAHGFATMRRNS